jgi:drug/metabolite transporter (DMT)-like permease
MKLSSLRPDIADGAMLAVVLMWAANTILIKVTANIQPLWGALVYAAVVSMLIGYSLSSWAMNRDGVARTAPYPFLIPLATGIMSAVALGEHFTPVKIGGALMVLAGTTLVRVLGRRVVAPAATREDVSAPTAVAVARGTN